MDRCAWEFVARRWWRRVEVWAIALLLVVGGGFGGYQLAQWALAKAYLEQSPFPRHRFSQPAGPQAL